MRMDGPGKAMNVSELLKEQKLLLLLFFFYFFIFIVPVGQQPCLDFPGRQDSNRVRIPFILLCQ